MKRKILLLTFIMSLCLLVFPACNMDTKGSIKALTKPYIAEYECVEAKLGDEDLLQKYEYIKITLLDKEELEISYKPVNGEKHSIKGAYEVDEQTREMTGEIGIFGLKVREKIKVEDGKFTIVRNVMGKPLVIKFKTK